MCSRCQQAKLSLAAKARKGYIRKSMSTFQQLKASHILTSRFQDTKSQKMSAASSNIKPSWALLDDFINSTIPSRRDPSFLDSFAADELVLALKRACERFLRLIEERSRLNMELRRLKGEHWAAQDAESLAFVGRAAGAGEYLCGRILNKSTFVGSDLKELKDEIMRFSDRMDGVAADVEDLRPDLMSEKAEGEANGASWALGMED